MYKLTHEELKQLQQQARQLPSFPCTTPEGDPIIKAYWITGKELKTMVKKGTWDGPKIGDLKQLKDKQKYGPLTGAMHRNALKGLISAVRNGGPQAAVDYYAKYMEEYKTYLKRKLDNTKLLKDKTINNETTKKTDSADGNVGRIISIDEHAKFRPDSSSPKGHSNNIKPESK